MTASRIFWIRVVLVLAGVSVLVFAQIVQERVAFERSITAFKDVRLDNYLRLVFPEQLFGDQRGAQPDQTAIRKRIAAFNEHHWPKQTEGERSPRIRVVRAGPIQGDDLTGGSVVSFTVQLASDPVPIEVDLVADKPSGMTFLGIALASSYLVAGFALAWLFPAPASFNAFPLARDMAMIFDRKVSAGQTWGMYRLSHLGGGGPLPGIPENDFDACNDETLRAECFRDVRSTYEALRPKFANSIRDPALRRDFLLAMDDGFRDAESEVREEAPWVGDDDEVGERFWPFVRHQLFGFAVIHLEDRGQVAKQTGLVPAAVTVERPPLWLIGGFEVYYPSLFFDRLVSEIRAGLVSAYGQAFDGVRIVADPEHPFVSIEFRCSGLAITPENDARLSEFIQTPFEGGLKRICMLMDGFGEVLIFDARLGFQLIRRKRCTERADAGLTVRLDFRRIAPSELVSVRKRFSA